MSHSHSNHNNGSPSLKALEPWYAVRTRSNCEKTVFTILTNKGFSPFLPAYKVRKRWSDRTVESERPLFPGYLFCRFDAIAKRVPILATPGVVSVLGVCGTPAPIPNHEIEAVESVLRSGRSAEPDLFLKEGQRVRITGGSLDGLEGILVKRKTEWRLLVAVTMLNRSVSIEVDRESVTTL